MFNKLLKYYNHSLLLTDPPNLDYYSNYHWFKDEASSNWLGIPFDAIHKRELTLLQSLFHYESLPSTMHPKAKKWDEFLFNKGEIPNIDTEAPYRFILFHLDGVNWERNDLEEAMYGFFHEDSVILWENQENGMIIERNPDPKLSEDLFLSLSQTLESDFFIKAYFYFGKILPLSMECPKQVRDDKYFFKESLQLMPFQLIHSFEKCFPLIVANELSMNMKEWLQSQILEKIKDDPELLTAVKHFLENNSNATLTAKKLYIHRNTLQYKLDKFSQKTGINLKDFHSSITVYLACLISEFEQT